MSSQAQVCTEFTEAKDDMLFDIYEHYQNMIFHHVGAEDLQPCTTLATRATLVEASRFVPLMEASRFRLNVKPFGNKATDNSLKKPEETMKKVEESGTFVKFAKCRHWSKRLASSTLMEASRFRLNVKPFGNEAH